MPGKVLIPTAGVEFGKESSHRDPQREKILLLLFWIFIYTVIYPVGPSVEML